MLAFTPNHETYRTGTEYVSGIVGRLDGDVTSAPRVPPHVEGVMDLRGDVTKITDPRTVLSFDLPADVDTEKVTVLPDAGGGNVGWAVTDVTEVPTIDTTDVDETAVATSTDD